MSDALVSAVIGAVPATASALLWIRVNNHTKAMRQDVGTNGISLADQLAALRAATEHLIKLDTYTHTRFHDLRGDTKALISTQSLVLDKLGELIEVLKAK